MASESDAPDLDFYKDNMLRPKNNLERYLQREALKEDTIRKEAEEAGGLGGNDCHH